MPGKSPPSDVEFGSFERSVLSERIVMRLMDMIRERKLRPGDRLPPERELAEMMGVSRPSLREALRALSIMNIIDNIQGSGTYVTALEPSRLVENLSFVISLDDSTFISALEARKVLEVGLAAMAAERITDEQLSELEQVLSRSEEVIQDAEAFLQCDMEIHRRIAEAAQNTILVIFMSSIQQVSLFSRRRTVELPEVARHTLGHHRELIAALKAHDPQAASQAMREHLDYVKNRLREASSQ
jgi:GntR family transcriptional repressor for pyruvate dehydrogenase complex